MGGNRNILILALILIGLGIVFFFSNQRREGIDFTGGFVDLVEGTLTTDEVFGIDVYRGDDQSKGFSLVKRGDEWVMPTRFDGKANVNKIRTLLGNLESLEGELRSEDASVLADYGLADTSAVHLLVKDESGNAVVDLLIGNQGASGGFVRESGSNRVLLGNRNLRGDFGMWSETVTEPDYKQWLDLSAYKVERNEVSSLRLVGEGRTLAMAKEFEEPDPADSLAAAAAVEPEYEWRVTEPQEFMAKKTRADGILNSLLNLRARDVVAAPESLEDYGLGPGADRVEVALNDGTTQGLVFGSAPEGEDDQLYFRVEGEDRYWLMPNFIKNNLFKDPEELKPE